MKWRMGRTGKGEERREDEKGGETGGRRERGVGGKEMEGGKGTKWRERKERERKKRE